MHLPMTDFVMNNEVHNTANFFYQLQQAWLSDASGSRIYSSMSHLTSRSSYITITQICSGEHNFGITLSHAIQNFSLQLLTTSIVRIRKGCTRKHAAILRLEIINRTRGKKMSYL